MQSALSNRIDNTRKENLAINRIYEYISNRLNPIFSIFFQFIFSLNFLLN